MEFLLLRVSHSYQCKPDAVWWHLKSSTVAWEFVSSLLNHHQYRWEHIWYVNEWGKVLFTWLLVIFAGSLHHSVVSSDVFLRLTRLNYNVLLALSKWQFPVGLQSRNCAVWNLVTCTFTQQSWCFLNNSWATPQLSNIYRLIDCKCLLLLYSVCLEEWCTIILCYLNFQVLCQIRCCASKTEMPSP